MNFFGKLKDWSSGRRETFGSALVKVLGIAVGGVVGYYFLKKNKILCCVYLAVAFLYSLACQRFGAQEKVFWAGLAFWWMLVWVVSEYVEKLVSPRQSAPQSKSLWNRASFWKKDNKEERNLSSTHK